MKATWVKRVLKAIPILLIALLLLLDAKPADAMPCFNDLATCYFQAATIGSFWSRFAAGLDCEFTFVGCLREDIGGW
jgi:hypothetical protein